MKKTILSISLLLMAVSTAMFISSCSKDDTAPDITVLGDNPYTLSLNSAYTNDAGATANDDKDGDVTANIETTDNINKDLAGSYEVTYTVTDKEGNVGVATRTVIVKNDAEAAWAGTYDGAETDANGPYTYVQDNIVTASTTVNNQILMTRLGDFANNTVYMNIVGNNISMPQQDNTNVGTGTNTCDVHDRRSSGVGVKNADGFGLTYSDEKLAPCSGSRTGVIAVFVKQ